jgi:hypothetical protein
MTFNLNKKLSSDIHRRLVEWGQKCETLGPDMMKQELS